VVTRAQCQCRYQFCDVTVKLRSCLFQKVASRVNSSDVCPSDVNDNHTHDITDDVQQRRIGYKNVLFGPLISVNKISFVRYRVASEGRSVAPR